MMTSIKSALPYLTRPTPHFFSPGIRRASFYSNHFMKSPIEFSSHQTRRFSQLPYVNSKGSTLNNIGKLSLCVIFGGLCLVPLFSYAKGTGVTASSADSFLSSAKLADEKALARYFELLEGFPKLKREGELNDYTKGTYEIIYDREGILAVKKEVYERLYNKSKSQGLTHSQADELATNFSRPGVVCEDQFWLWIRDAVISPQGYKHTYNRIVWKCDLERIGGAATLPILIENGTKKIVLHLAFRHATNSWEMEMARGNSKPNETSIDTAKREVLEETGYVTGKLVSLGSMTPDSGLTASVIPVFSGQVVAEKETRHDKTEAIKEKYAFTLTEIMEGLKRGYMEVEINKKVTQVPIRDPFLAYALLMAQYDGLL